MIYDGGRIKLRPIEANWDDAYTICKWRNTPEARKNFFNKEVVTPGTHMEFMKNKGPHDLVWIIESDQAEYIGMLSLKVDTINHTGEYGRVFIDDKYRGQGYAEEAEYLILKFAFDYLRLNSIWLEAFSDNTAVIALHKKTGFKEVHDGWYICPRGVVIRMKYCASKWKGKK
jgi:RimJ/RimL family protein N-acetyltransferase